MYTTEKIESFIANGIYSGPCSIEKIIEAENALGIRFPSEYFDFLQKYGALIVNGAEVYGLPDVSENEPPLWQNVVEVQAQLKKWGQAGTENRKWVAFSEDGTGIYFFLDTSISPKSRIYAVGIGVEKQFDCSFYEFICDLSEGKISY